MRNPVYVGRVARVYGNGVKIYRVGELFVKISADKIAKMAVLVDGVWERMTGHGLIRYEAEA